MSVQSVVKIQDFKNVAVKSVNVLEREGKKSLVFVDLVDTDSFQNTGDMMFLKKDMSTNDILNLKTLERQQVNVTFSLGVYNNRPSINIVDLVPVKA